MSTRYPCFTRPPAWLRWTLFSLSLLATAASAQSTGKVDFQYLGISFTIPEGWVGQEVDGGYLIGSHTQPGLVMLTLHELTSVSALRANGAGGIVEEGVMLQPAGELEAIGDNGIGGEFSGTLSGQPAKAYIVGLVNPHGKGVTIMAATEPAKYSAEYRKLALAVATSTRFSAPEKPPIVDEWKQTLRDMRLTYMDSYYSSGSSYGGYSTGGGYSSKIKIDLCSAGHFTHSSRSSVSIDTGGAYGSSAGRSGGHGSWDVVGGAQGQAVLVLNFHDGRSEQYNLDYRDKKTLLNGQRWFRTNDAVCY